MNEVTYHAAPNKCTIGYSPEYTWISCVDGVPVSCARGNHYSGCWCNLNERSKYCDTECAQNCINTILGMMDDTVRDCIGKIEI